MVCDCVSVVSVDPCISLPDGDYPLDERFIALLPSVNPRCNFIKCAHRSAFVNPCSAGTRNPDHDLALNAADPQSTGAHYCSVRDVGDLCEHHYYHPPYSINDDDDDKTSEDELQEPNVKHYYIVWTLQNTDDWYCTCFIPHSVRDHYSHAKRLIVINYSHH